MRSTKHIQVLAHYSSKNKAVAYNMGDILEGASGHLTYSPNLWVEIPEMRITIGPIVSSRGKRIRCMSRTGILRIGPLLAC